MQLAEFDILFQSLSPVTVSRWENAQSRPSIMKIIRIVEFFGDNPSVILPSLIFVQRNSLSRSVVEHVISKMTFAPQGTQIGGFPVVSNYKVTDLFKDYSLELVELLLEFDHSIYNTEFPVTEDTLVRWATHNDNICLVCTLRGQYIGHLVALRLKQSVFSFLINGRREESSISTADFSALNEEHCLYIYSIYGANKVVASYFIIELIRNMFLANGRCICIGGLCATPDGVSLAKQMGLSIRTLGPKSTESPIHVGGSDVKWVTYSGNVADVFDAVGDNVLAGVQLNI